MSNLLDLPQDVLLDITKYLDSKDVRGLREVNKSDIYPLIDTLQQTTLRRPDIFRPSFYETLSNFEFSGYFFVKTTFEKNNEIINYPSNIQYDNLRNKPLYMDFMMMNNLMIYQKLNELLKIYDLIFITNKAMRFILPQHKLYDWINDDTFIDFIADKFKNYFLDSNHIKKRTLKISLKPFFLLHASAEYNNSEDERAFTMEEKDLIDNFKIVFNFYKVKNVEFK
jgi:hypothetical protein